MAPFAAAAPRGGCSELFQVKVKSKANEEERRRRNGERGTRETVARGVRVETDSAGMRVGDRWEAHVLVDDMKVEEFNQDGQIYIESTFSARSTEERVVHELDPHGEPYDQVKPFTPFKVRVSVRSFHDHGESFFVLLYLDGELAQRKILDSNHFCHDFPGFAARMGYTGGERAFEFCIPPPARFLSKEEKERRGPRDPANMVELESIRVDIHRARFLYRQEREGYGAGGRQASVSKDDANVSVQGGETLGYMHEGRFSDYYESPSISNKVASARFKYRTRPMLVHMGLVAPPVGAANPGAEPRPAASRFFCAENLAKDIGDVFGLVVTQAVKSELQKEERMASAFLPTVRAPVLLKPEEICTDAGRVAQGPSRIAESRSMEQIKAALAEQSGLVPEDPPLGANGLGSLLRALSHQIFCKHSMSDVLQAIIGNFSPSSATDVLRQTCTTLGCSIAVHILDHHTPALFCPSQDRFAGRCFMLGLAPAGAEKTLWISLINQVRLSFPTGDEQVLQNIVSGMSQLNTPLEFQDQVLDERKVRRDAREQKKRQRLT